MISIHNQYRLTAFVLCLSFLVLRCQEISQKKQSAEEKTAYEVTNDFTELEVGVELSIFDSLRKSWLFPSFEKQKLKNSLITEGNKFIPDERIAVFLNDYNINLNSLNEILLNSDEYETLSTLIWADTLRHDPIAKKFKNKVERLGYQIATPEGILQLDKNLSFLSNDLSDHFSRPMKEYWNMYQTEQENVFAIDAAIIQPIQKIIERIVYWERFLVKYPDFVLKDQIAFEAKRYIYFLFAGMDNTPIFSSYEEGKINDEFLKGYYYAIEQYPDTDYAQNVSTYLDLLEKHEYKNGQHIEDFLKDFTF